MGILYRILELGVYIPFLAMPLIAWRLDLFRCAVLTGRSFFAFLISLWLYRPLSRLAVMIFNRPPPFFNATFFPVIWIIVWFLLPFAILRVLKPHSRRPGFTCSAPGRIISGALAGWFMTNALVAFLVMMPRVEGAYFARDAHPLFQRDRRSALLYSSFTFTTPDVLLCAQQEAAAEWVFRRIRREEFDRLPDAVSVPEYFDRRYRSPWPAERSTLRRRELKAQIEEALARHGAETRFQSP